MPLAAYVLGGRIVEKHFTLNRALKGTDHRFSLEPVGLRKLVRDLQRTRLALGSKDKVPHPSEVDPITKMGKKIVAAGPLPAGHVLRREDLALKSPGDGLPPYELDNVVGRVLRHPLSEDSELTFEHLEELLPSGRRSRPPARIRAARTMSRRLDGGSQIAEVPALPAPERNIAS